jgi:peptidoglycan/xylan/chitin deacetylase (PgdA/CDA1 family)
MAIRSMAFMKLGVARHPFRKDTAGISRKPKDGKSRFIAKEYFDLVMRLRIIALFFAKYCGLFYMSRLFTKHALRILCYHGISIKDEHLFRSRLFLSPDTFRNRLLLIKKHGYNVMGLSEAVEALTNRVLPANAIVITFDDGWYGIHKHALPILKELGFKATIYITSYYAEKETQVFNVAVQFLFWKSNLQHMEMKEICRALCGSFDLGLASDRQLAVDAVIDYGTNKCNAGERQRLLHRLGEILGVNNKDLEQAGCFKIMSLSQIREASAAGIDIQLHTHRHSLAGLSISAVKREIYDNRRALEAITATPPSHFCYPSGFYSELIWPALRELGIETAATCLSGFNYPETPLMELRRFLDAESILPIEFEAELSGFLEICRRMRFNLSILASSIGRKASLTLNAPS